MIIDNPDVIPTKIKTCVDGYDFTRDADDRCPSKPLPLNAPLRIFPSYSCFKEEIKLPSNQHFCGEQQTPGTAILAAVCASNISVARQYMNQTIVPVFVAIPEGL